MSSMNTTDQPKKAVASKRILACVLCQQRKKKCDRRSPCSNCIKLNVVCTPSTPAPPRKRRRPNQELLERLARCEAMLRHCTCIRLPTPERTPSEQSSVASDEIKEEIKRDPSPYSTDTREPLNGPPL
ncbi:hypothetical protein ACJ41O_000167 [Fusarium nematophilum]